jgi:hypothetical protein
MLFCYIISTSAIDQFFLSVQDTGPIEDADGIDGPPWTLDRAREWTVMV